MNECESASGQIENEEKIGQKSYYQKKYTDNRQHHCYFSKDLPLLSLV